MSQTPKWPPNIYQNSQTFPSHHQPYDFRGQTVAALSQAPQQTHFLPQQPNYNHTTNPHTSFSQPQADMNALHAQQRMLSAQSLPAPDVFSAPSVNNPNYPTYPNTFPAMSTHQSTTSLPQTFPRNVPQSDESGSDDSGSDDSESEDSEPGFSSSRQPRVGKGGRPVREAARRSYTQYSDQNYHDETLASELAQEQANLAQQHHLLAAKGFRATLGKMEANSQRHHAEPLSNSYGGPNIIRSRRHYVSQQKKLLVEKICAQRWISENKEDGTMFFVTWKGMSYLHGSWVTEQSINDEGAYSKTKLQRFLKKFPDPLVCTERTVFPVDYTQSERILAARHGPGWNQGDQRYEYLVKWYILPYSQSTWEFPEDFQTIPPRVKHGQTPHEDSKIAQFRKLNMPPILGEEPIRPPYNQFKKWTVSPPYKHGHVLRPWQVEGVSWLLHNWYHRRGAILADEMGLGKTVQVVAMLKHIANCYCRGPFLVVAPLSTVGHWKREFEEWTDFNVVIYQGTKEDRQIIHQYEWSFWDKDGFTLKNMYKFTVVICTYETVMLETTIASVRWKMCIVDEAHRLKNRNSKLSKCLRNFDLEHSFILTGTPIQNNIEELWTLLNFIQPNSFPSQESFAQEYGDLKDHKQVEKLHNSLKPYLLRRLKEDVAKNIPPKKETIVEVELTSVQKKYYRAILEKNREFLYKGCKSGNVPKLVNIVMQLRKVCNHPYLIPGVQEKVTAGQAKWDKLRLLTQASGKLVLIDKLLPKLKVDGHRVLLFSQMKMVLNLLETYLKLKEYTYERIDGNVRGNDRQAAIDRFQNEGKAFVFLLSTRAGGVGINLARADTVIIYDSDWNPQNDVQAQARCHRIGQENEVKVYRLITSRTYEKDMFIRASMKLGLDQAILKTMKEADGTNVAIQSSSQTTPANLKKEEIESLLKHGAYDIFNDNDDEAEQFCEEDIDQILKHRSTVLTHSFAEKTSSFSKATFMSADADAEIDVNAPDFWEKVLPEDMNPDRMAVMLDSGEAYETIEKRRKFIEELSVQVKEITSLRSQGITPVQESTITSILHRVARMTQSFDQNQRTQCFQWLGEIEHPRRRKNRYSKVDDIQQCPMANSRKRRRTTYIPHMPNSFGNRQFNRQERTQYEDAIMSISSSAQTKELWPLVLKHCEVVRRSNEELCGYGVVLMEMCATLCEVGDVVVFRSTKDHLIRNLPVTQKNKQRRSTYQPPVDPATCTLDTFPCFNDPQYIKHVTRRTKKWSRILRLGRAVQNELERYDNPTRDLQIPDKCPHPPVWWWSQDELVYDKDLILGVGKHGFCGWEKIKNDPDLAFYHKVHQVAKSATTNGVQEMDTSSDASSTSSTAPPQQNGFSKVEMKTNSIVRHRLPQTDDLPSPHLNQQPNSLHVNSDQPQPAPFNKFPFPNGTTPTGTGPVGSSATQPMDLSTSNGVEPPAAHASSSSTGSGCVCRQPDDQGFMIECELCHKWCHGRCVNVSQNQVPKTWYCPRCDIEWPAPKNLEGRVKAIMDTIAEIRQAQREEEEKIQIQKLRDVTRANRIREWSKRERSELAGCLTMFGKLPPERVQELGGLSRKTPEQIDSFYRKYMTQCEYLIDREDYDFQQEIFKNPKLPPRDKIKRLHDRRPRPRHGPYRVVQKHCYCRNYAGPGLMIVCTNCQKWYHKDCTGILGPIPDKFECRFCLEAPPPEKKRRKIIGKRKLPSTPSGYRASCRNPMSVKSPLYESCELLVKELYNHNYADQFDSAVDPQVLGLDNYFDIVHYPMDLSTIKDNLLRGAYPCPAVFAEDTRLIFRNCRHYNESTADIVQMADTLSTIFEDFYARLVPRHQQLQGIDEMDYYQIPEPKPPKELADENLTTKFARKIKEHVNLHDQIQACIELGDETIRTALYIHAKNHCGSSSYSLPEWWNPPVHDLMVLEATPQYGLGQGKAIMANTDYRKVCSDQSQISYFMQFVTDRTPLIRRLQYICFIVLHTNEPYETPIEPQPKSYDLLNYKPKPKRKRDHSESPAPSTKKTRKKEIQRGLDGQPIFPIRTKGANVHCLGHIVVGPSGKAWHTPSYIWPEGFRSTRTYTSYKDPDIKVEYTSEIIAQSMGGGPCFKVTAEDDRINAVVKETASGAWCAILEKINQKKTTKRNKVTVSGPEMFGYSDQTIKSLIEELPGAAGCSKYWAKKNEKSGKSY